MPSRPNPSRRYRVRRPASGRALCRALATSVLVGSSVLVAACGSSNPPTILNTEKVERAIEQSTFTQRHKRVNVTCPSGVHQTKGIVFACTAYSRGAATRFVVTELDGRGNVHYQAR